MPAFVLHPGDTGRDKTEKASVSHSLHFVKERQTQTGNKRSERCEKYGVSDRDARESGWRGLAGVVGGGGGLSEERKSDQDPEVGCLQPLKDPGEKCFRQRN